MTTMKEQMIKWALYLIALVLINLAGITLFFRLDLTENQKFSLSEASREIVATLSEPLEIKVFFSQNLPAPHNNTQQYLKDLLQEYQACSGKYFNYAFYDISSKEAGLGGTADENRQMAEDYGISPVQIRMVENDEIKFQNAYMGLVILHGDLMEKIPAIADTGSLEYQLTTAIEKLNNKISALLRIKDKVEVKLYLSSSLYKVAPLMGLNQLSSLENQVKTTIEGLNKKNADVFQFASLNPASADEIEKISKKYSLMSMAWPNIPEKHIEKGQGIAGIVVEYQGQFQSIPLISAFDMPIIGTTYQMTEPETLAETIPAIMEKMIGINTTIGYLADHDTLSLGQNPMDMMQGPTPSAMKAFNHLISKRYDIKPVHLEDGKEIPQGLDCLIIARPTKKFSPYELFQIDQALMRGVNIAFFSDAFAQSPPTRASMGMPGFSPIDTGLEKLFAHYGISMEKAYVLDTSCYKQMTQQNGEQNIYFAPMIKEKTINLAPAYMNNIKGLVAMQISPLSLDEKKIAAEKVKATRLFSSSDKAWLMAEPINLNPMMISPPPAEEGYAAYDLAYMLEGEFTSYFADKELPKREISETDIADSKKAEHSQKSAPAAVVEKPLMKTSKPAKIFFLGCTQMIQDNMLDPQGESTNATFILNAIDHLNGKDKIAVLRSKEQGLNPIAPLTPFTKTIIKGINIVLLPCLVVILGLIVWGRRNARKKAIAKIFANG